MVEKSKINVKKNNAGSGGFSLLEVVIAVFVGSIIGIAALSLLNARAVSVLENQDVQEAETRAEEALSSLTAVASDLPVGGSFIVLDEDNKIKLDSDCTDQTCDYVLLPSPPENQRTSPAKGFPFSSSVPEGSQVLFLRRWRVDETDGEYGLRKITVAVLKDENSKAPIILEDAIEPQAR